MIVRYKKSLDVPLKSRGILIHKNYMRAHLENQYSSIKRKSGLNLHEQAVNFIPSPLTKSKSKSGSLKAHQILSTSIDIRQDTSPEDGAQCMPPSTLTTSLV